MLYLSGGRQTYYCQICLERQPMERGYRLSACGDIFCRECLSAWVSSRVAERGVHLRCISDQPPAAPADGGSSSGGGTATPRPPRPAPAPARAASADGTAAAAAASASARAARLVCNVPLAESDIKELLGDAAAIARYERFLAESHDPNLRECPSCGNGQSGAAAAPAMTCDRCGAEFCFLHASAHRGSTCAAYERAHLEETRLNEAAMAADSKGCPRCAIRIIKSSGCNQMSCVCGCHFCWLCGQEIDGSTLPDHFASWNLRGCTGAQFRSTRPGPLSRALSVLSFVFLGVPSFLITLALYLACCCICVPAGCGYERGTLAFLREMTTLVAVVVTALVFIALGTPFVVAGGAIYVLLLCLCLPAVIAGYRRRARARRAAAAAGDAPPSSPGVAPPHAPSSTPTSATDGSPA
jgi:hypothetical protein